MWAPHTGQTALGRTRPVDLGSRTVRVAALLEVGAGCTYDARGEGVDDHDHCEYDRPLVLVTVWLETQISFPFFPRR